MATGNSARPGTISDVDSGYAWLRLLASVLINTDASSRNQA